MTTPLQTAALAVIDKWVHSHPLKELAILELRKALDAELQQAVEPVAWTWDTSGTGGVMEGFVEAHFAFNKPHPDKRILNLTPLYLHPPQPQATTAVPSGERADSAQWLREFADMEFSYYSLEATQLRKAADMLEADAQQDKPYDQQSMDLCDTCGWKGIFPGEPCLVCVQQAKRVPMTGEEIAEIALDFCLPQSTRSFARAIEAHHGITPADKPTDDESEDLYALALKADNWGQP